MALKELAKDKYAKAVVKDWNTTGFSDSLALMYSETVESDREWILHPDVQLLLS